MYCYEVCRESSELFELSHHKSTDLHQVFFFKFSVAVVIDSYGTSKFCD